MTTTAAREVAHEIRIAAPADTVYRLLAEADRWPQIFDPTIYVDHLERSETEERIRIWATANGAAKNWTSRRVLDPSRRTIEFRQEVSTPPVAAMSGTWVIVANSATSTTVRLLHSYRAVDDDPDGLKWIDEAVDRNSRTELAGLRTTVEQADAARELTFSFEDSVRIAGRARDVFDFIDRAELWQERLPHVASVRLEEPTPGLQVLEMDTRAQDGSVHTTKSYRVTFGHHTVVYKQVTLPALLTLHTGRWTFEPVDDGVVATSQHTVTIDRSAIERILGAGKTVADATDYVRSALSANSTATLRHAKAYAENRV